MEEKIVITGLGAVTPVGIGVPEFWKNLTEGVCGISKIEKEGCEDLAVQIAGQVKNFVPENYMAIRVRIEVPAIDHTDRSGAYPVHVGIVSRR